MPLAPLALTDAEHTAAGGHFSSSLLAVCDQGIVAGASVRYLGGSASQPRGTTTWLADASGRLVTVGFDDAEHTDPSTGSQESAIVALTPTGIALGTTRRPGGGWTAWRATIDGGTERLGFYDGPHARSPNGQPPVSVGQDIADDGAVVGYSEREDGGRTAWTVDAAGVHTALLPPVSDAVLPTGTTSTAATEINTDGYILGTASRWVASNGGTAEERDVGWMRVPDGTYLVWDEAYRSGVYGLTESGFFALSQGTPGASAAVVHVSGDVRSVGFKQDEDTSDRISFLSESGVAAGSTGLYFRPSSYSWISTPGQGTAIIELEGYWGSRGDGATRVAMNDDGALTGYTTHIDGSTAAWLTTSGGAITRIGLYGGVYDGPMAARVEPVHLNYSSGVTNSGFVWGQAMRLQGDWTAEGQTAWIHDSAAGSTTSLEISVRTTDGYAYSQVAHVLENGIAIGSFRKFGAAGIDLGSRSFVYLPDHGPLEVDQNTTVPIWNAGWRTISSVDFATEAGLLAGVGVPTAGPPSAQAVCLLRIVDEPPAAPGGAPLHYLGRLGLYDSRHTAASGHQDNTLVDFAETGYSLGQAALHVGANDVPAATGRAARSAWLGTPNGGTLRIGLYNTLHTRDDGRQENTPVAVNDGGVTIGHAARFAGHAYRGESAWVADRHGTVIQVGFYDAAHTGADGSKISRAVALNRANRLIGYSQHPDTFATTAWLATSTGSIQRIGLLDAAHTAPDGTRVSLPSALNDAGHVVGTSEHYIPGVTMTGLTAWLRHPGGVVRRVGFETGVHRASNGQHESHVAFLNATSRLAGYSVRYHPTELRAMGRTTWMTHVDGPNKPIGFRTGRHAGPGNLAYSGIVGLNDAGYAIGFSAQFTATSAAPTDARGRTAWIARPDATTVRVGLYGSAYDRGGFQYNVPRTQDSGGGVAGTAERYISGSYRGLDAWVADATGETRRIGLLDAPHVRADLHRISTPGPMTASGWVAGTSARYHGSVDAGQTAWIYNRQRGEYQRFELSVRAADGYAYAVITHLFEDGRARGVFRKFSANGVSLGDRAFYFVPGRGTREVGYATDIDLNEHGWALFVRVEHATPDGFMVGEGQLLGPTRGRGVFMLSE